MPKRTSYRQGMPNWVELQTTDQEGAKAFYGGLFGWRFDESPVPPGRRAYSMAYRGDGVVAAIASEPAAQGAPPGWRSYLAVDDVDAAAKAVPGAGGTVTVEPFDVSDAGRMAFVLDPTGAAIGLWQAHRHIGATVRDEPGTVAWNELLTDDVDAAAAFYQRLLGLTPVAVELDGTPWSTLNIGADAVAGVVRKPADRVPTGWYVYFATDDVPATARRATELGGTVIHGPVDTGIGPMAGVLDPQGALFSLWTFVPPAG